MFNYCVASASFLETNCCTFENKGCLILPKYSVKGHRDWKQSMLTLARGWTSQLITETGRYTVINSSGFHVLVLWLTTLKGI